VHLARCSPAAACTCSTTREGEQLRGVVHSKHACCALDTHPRPHPHLCMPPCVQAARSGSTAWTGMLGDPTNSHQLFAFWMTGARPVGKGFTTEHGSSTILPGRAGKWLWRLWWVYGQFRVWLAPVLRPKMIAQPLLRALACSTHHRPPHSQSCPAGTSQTHSPAGERGVEGRRWLG